MSKTYKPKAKDMDPGLSGVVTRKFWASVLVGEGGKEKQKLH